MKTIRSFIPHFLFPNSFITIKIISPTTNTTRKMPKPIPALNIDSITWHPEIKTNTKRIRTCIGKLV